MIRYIFALLLLVHGLIHALGFINQWMLDTGTQLSGKTLIYLSKGTSNMMGLLWLLTGLGFLSATTGFWFRRDWCLATTLVSLVFSQALIILYWPEAKAGSVANGLIAIVLVISYAHKRFEQQADGEVRELFRQPSVDTSVITPDRIVTLPAPVQQWLLASGVLGKERVHTVRLRQFGLMRTDPKGKWMPTEAEQYFGVDKPGFIWKADVQMMPFLSLAGRDKYADGKGNMLIMALSLFPVVNAADAKTDQGTLLRYLGEMCWFPSAALSPYINWKPLDDHQAEATMNYKGVSVTAVFAFDDRHRLESITANRYMGGGKEGKLEKWFIKALAWKPMHGVTIPVKGNVMWRLPGGDFTYYKWEITDIDYNKPVLY